MSRLPHGRSRLWQVDPSRSSETWPKGLVVFASWSARWRGSVPRTLSLRLRALEEEGIVERHTFPEVPPRVEYALTEKGEALVPLVEDMRRYGTRWLFEDAPAACRSRSRRRLSYVSASVRASAGAPGTGGKLRGVRDRLLNESLTRLASEAAIKLSALVAGGDQIPFDVDSENGDDSLFYSYRPLTSLYVREREGELRGLDAFAPARDTVAAAGIATAYLEARGEQVPGDPGERAAQMLTVFLASLWDGMHRAFP